MILSDLNREHIENIAKIIRHYIPNNFSISVTRYGIEYDCNSNEGFIVVVQNQGSIYCHCKDNNQTYPCDKAYEVIKYLEKIGYNFVNSPEYVDSKIDKLLN
jgi:hypothetical protein